MADIKTVQLLVNSEQAQNKLKEINKQLDIARQKKTEAFKMGDAKGIEVYSKEIKKLERQAAKMQTRAETITKTFKNLDKATPKELKATIKEINKELNSGKIERGSKEWEKLNEALIECNGELQKIKEESKAAGKLTDSIADFGTKWVGIIGSIQMGWEVLDKVRNSMGEYVSAYLDMAEAESQVTKYTGMTTEEVKELNEEFKKMDTRTSREQLNALAGDAGRLGITGKQGVLDFVEAADMINVALGEDLGEDAVKNIGKLAQLFGDDDKIGLKQAMISTGSVINHLGSISSASESYIVDFTGRLSSMAATAKMSQADVMGLAAVLDQGMVASEQASTALSSIIQKLYKDTNGMASAVGLNVQEFATLLKTDANEALMTWLDAVNKMGGMDVIAPLLGDLKLSGAGVSKTIATLAGNIDQVRSTQEEANKAFQEGTSILSEVEKANSTPLAQLEKAKNLARDASAELGEHLFPIITGGINTGTLFINILTTIIGYIKENWTTLLGITAAIGAYTIAVYAATIKEKALLAIETLKLQRDKARLAVTKASTVATTSLRIVSEACKIVYYRLTGQTIAMTAAQTALNAAMAGNPIGAVLKVVVTLVAALGSWFGITKLLNKATEQSTQLQEKQLSAIERAQEKAIENMAQERTRVEELVNIINSEAEAYDAKKKAMLALEKIVPGFKANISDEIKLTKENTAAIQTYIKQLENKAIAQAYYEELVELYKKRIPLANKVNKLLPGYKAAEKEMLDSYKNGTPTQYNRYGVDVDSRNAKFREATAEYQTAAKALLAVDNEISELKEKASEDGVKGFFNDLIVKDTTTGTGNYDFSDDSGNTNSTTKSETTSDPNAEQAKNIKKQAEKEINEQKIKYHQKEITEEELAAKTIEIEQEMYKQIRDLYQKDSAEWVENEEARLRKSTELAEQNKKEKEKVRVWSLRQAEIERDAELGQAKEALANGMLTYEEYKRAEAQIEKRYMEARIALAKEAGNDQEAEELELEMARKVNEEKFNQVKAYYEKAEEYRKEYFKQSGKARLEEEEKLLKEMVDAKVLTEEEAQKILKEIHKKYKDANDSPLGDADGLAGNVVNLGEMIDKLQDKLKKNEASWEDWGAVAVASLSMVGPAMQAASQLMQANMQAEEAAINKRYDAEIKRAGETTEKGKQLEEQKQKELAEIKEKYNKRSMVMEIAQATASTAMAAINAYASGAKVNVFLGPIAAAAALAAGAMQIAAIKKQHDAQAAGYYDGGFTGGSSYRRTAGVVHEGEFVANHRAVNNPNVLPVLRMLDYAQRNNTIASVSSADIAHAAGGANGQSAVAPVVIHETSRTSEALERLNEQLSAGIHASVNITGDDGIAKQWDRYNRMKRNAH